MLYAVHDYVWFQLPYMSERSRVNVPQIWRVKIYGTVSHVKYFETK